MAFLNDPEFFNYLLDQFIDLFIVKRLCLLAKIELGIESVKNQGTKVDFFACGVLHPHSLIE